MTDEVTGDYTCNCLVTLPYPLPACDVIRIKARSRVQSVKVSGEDFRRIIQNLLPIHIPTNTPNDPTRCVNGEGNAVVAVAGVNSWFIARLSWICVELEVEVGSR